MSDSNNVLEVWLDDGRSLRGTRSVSTLINDMTH